MNYFELFGLAESPMVDRKELMRRYVQLQKEYHPDFFSQDSSLEQEQALEKSAAINEGYRIFSDPQQTVAYYLRNRGVMAADEKYQLPADFLMEMMEWNEALESMDPSLVKEAVAAKSLAWWEPIQQRLQETTGAPDDALMAELKAYYYKKKYLDRILDRLAD
jgi:molecular chaperone HscB